MAARVLTPGWEFDISDSPEWLFLRLKKVQEDAESCPAVAESAWDLSQQYEIRRIVFELDESVMLTSYLIGQIVLLHKRLNLAGGVLRLCGLSAETYRVIEFMQLGSRLPNYADRAAAVNGHLNP